MKNEIRILSLNMHKGVGWLTPRSTLKRMREQIRKLHPDLVFLQEARGTQFEFIADNLWPYFSYGKNATHVKGHYGNAILSKFPIVFSKNTDISMGVYERRGLLHSVVNLPNSKRLNLLCVHLGLLKKDRHKQLKRIVEYIHSHVPKDELLILAGDFNDWRNHATEPLINGLGLEEAFLNRHGKYAKTYPAWAPMLHLDRIYSRGFSPNQAQRLVNHSWKFLSDHVGIEVSLKFLS